MNVTAPPAREKRLDLTGHLTELRNRIIRSVVYLVAGSTAGWSFYGPIFRFLSAPLQPYLTKTGSRFLITGVLEGCIIKTEIALLAGAILTLPLIIGELWGFISPGLMMNERRFVFLAAPLTVLLFLLGVATAWLIFPMCIVWLMAQNPPNAVFMPSVSATIIFILKMCLAFGIVFQMPVLLMFLAQVEIINARMLTQYWRHAVVIISIVAAIVTPSNDAFSMMMMCIPMVILYFAGIGLVRLVEKRRG
jgi:sec-independent protein translocase protein TatC